MNSSTLKVILAASFSLASLSMSSMSAVAADMSNSGPTAQCLAAQVERSLEQAATSCERQKTCVALASSLLVAGGTFATYKATAAVMDSTLKVFNSEALKSARADLADSVTQIGRDFGKFKNQPELVGLGLDSERAKFIVQNGVLAEKEAGYLAKALREGSSDATGMIRLLRTLSLRVDYLDNESQSIFSKNPTTGAFLHMAKSLSKRFKTLGLMDDLARFEEIAKKHLDVERVAGATSLAAGIGLIALNVYLIEKIPSTQEANSFDQLSTVAQMACRQNDAIQQQIQELQ